MGFKKWILIGLMAALILLQAGCGSPDSNAQKKVAEQAQETAQAGEEETPQAAAPDDKIQYKVSIDFKDTFVFDAEGNQIPEEKQMTVLYDKITGQPLCQMRKVLTDSGKDTEYGTPLPLTTSYLYDMDGTLFYEGEEEEFEDGFGEFLIRRDPQGNVVTADDLPPDFHSELWNFKTKETVLDQVAFFQPMNEDNSRFLMTNYFGYLLGVTDQEARVISGFPPPEGYYSSDVWNGMIISSNTPYFTEPEEGERQDVLLTEQLEPVFSASNINGTNYGLRNGYLMVGQGDAENFMDQQLNVLYSLPHGRRVQVSYFDGELLIRNRPSEDPKAEEEETVVFLEKTDGTKLADGYDWITPMQRYLDTIPAQKFIAGKGDRVELLDRQGKTLAQTEVAGAEGANVIGEDLITCQTEENGEALLNGKLEILIEPGKYRWIQRVSEWQGGKSKDYDLLECRYYLSSEDPVNRFDILDFSCNPVIQGATSIGTVGPDRIAVVRGFSVGLIDWKGNWIAKESIFQKPNDDEDEWGIYE